MSVKFFYPDEAARRREYLEDLLREHARAVKSGSIEDVDSTSQKIRDFKVAGDER